MSLTHQTVSGVKWNSVATIATVIVQFISIVVLARLLDPEDFGLMSMAIVVTGFAKAFADFGFSNAIIHRQDTTREQLSTLYWSNLLVGFSLFGLIWLAIPLAVTYYQEPRLTPILRWVAITFLILPVGQQFQSLLRRELRFTTLSLIQIAQSLFYAVSAVGYAIAGFGVMSLVWGSLIQALVGSILLVGIAIQSHWLPNLHFRRHDLDGFIQFGLFQMGERSLNYLSANVDYLIIGRFLGSEALGFYTLAYNLMRMPLSYLNPMIVSVAFPAFARVQHQDDILRRGYVKILHYLSAITFPLMAGLFVTAPLLVPLVYGVQWSPAVSVIQIFALLGALKSLSNPLGSLLLAKGRADFGFWMNMIATVGCIISNLIGVRWGITGVAASSLIFSAVVLLPIDFYLRHLVVDMTVKEFWFAIKQPTVSTSIMFSVIFPLYFALSLLEHDWVVLGCLATIGIIIYTIAIRLLDGDLFVEISGYLKPTPVTKA
jgi:lipopolysaccharide exporter